MQGVLNFRLSTASQHLASLLPATNRILQQSSYSRHELTIHSTRKNFTFCISRDAKNDGVLSSHWKLCNWEKTELNFWKHGQFIPRKRVECKYSRGFKKDGPRGKRSRLEERIRKGFKNVGLEAQYNSLPQWSGAVPYVVVGLEALMMVAWAATGMKGRNLQLGATSFSGEGFLIITLGFNFVIGWLASLVSTWRVKSLSPFLLPQERRGKTKPSFLDFFVSCWVNLIPFGNFLLWLRNSVKESRSESAVNALVYVLPTLFRLVFWTQGLSLGRLEQFAWLLGAIHRPYDAARLRNERVIVAARERQRELDAKEQKKQELSVEELAFIQERKELEDFDLQLAKSANSPSAVAGSPKEWSVGDVLQWLGKEGFARYASNFADNDVDGAILLQLTSDDLRDELDIQSFGDRKKLENCIDRLKSGYGR
ncbi:hypothetical protein R1sor_015882 [Riccia sorocarpa]|uniref:SAM domain-containing protein n=1 Tax=Riccia sorocarpa TaxID=122646 RepID=A0ABD3HDU9_9MARC